MASTDAGLSSLALATYSTNTYYSTYFDGALTSYLSLPTNAAWQFGSGNFCLETWAYITSYSSSGVCFFGVWGASNRGWIMTVTSTTINLVWSTTGADSASIVATTTVALNQWNHFAFVRNGTSGFIYLNGVQVGTGSMSGVTVFNSTGPLYIGANKQDVDSSITNYHMKGYLSNVRIVKGSPVYTSAFNPPTIQLTAITNTALLTCKTNNFTDESVNNFTITRVGNVGFKQFTPLLQANASVTLSPTFSTGTTSYTFNAPANVVAIAVTPTAVDPALASIKYNANVTLTSGQSNIASSMPSDTTGYSAAFTAGVLQYANASQINTQGYSWTAEMYVNPTGNYTNHNVLFAKRVSGAATTAYEGYLVITTGYLSFFNGTVYNSTYALTPNVWSHVAYTYDGNQLSIYVNGNKVYGVVVTVTDNTEPLTIGGARGFTEWMIGNISNFRFVKGYQIYTQNFTPPTDPLGLTQSASTGIRAIVSSNINSGFFSGTNAYLTAPGTGITNIFTGDFTIEAWLYPTAAFGASWVTADGSFSDIPVMICNASPTSLNYYWAFGPSSTGTVRFITSSIYFNTVTSTATCTINAWNHLALVKIGTTYKIYVNGVGTAGTTITNTAFLDTVGISIGANNNKYVTGYISNARIVKGTGVYTENFTPSTTPLTSITNTSLLILQNRLTNDASTNNLTLTNTNVTLSASITPFNSASTTSTQFLSTALAYQTVSNPYSPALSLGQGHNNFTAEAWVYLNATPPVAPGWYIMQKGVGTGPGVEWSFSVTSTGLYFQTQSGIPYATITSTAFGANIIPGQWMHLALTKVGTSVHVWFNGKYTGTVNGVNNLFYIASPTSYITIANTQTGGTTAFAGFISNARVVYGKAVYTANYDIGFTPSTSPLTTTQSATATTASIDNASNHVVATGSSVYFNNSNDFLSFVEPVTYSGVTPQGLTCNGDLTIEAWVMLTAAPTTRGWIVSNTQASTYFMGVAIEAARTVTIWAGSTVTPVITTATLIPLYTWTHIAFVNASSALAVYINGVRDANTTTYTKFIGTFNTDERTLFSKSSPLGYAGYFSSGTAYITTPLTGLTSLCLTGDFTIELWASRISNTQEVPVITITTAANSPTTETRLTCASGAFTYTWTIAGLTLGGGTVSAGSTWSHFAAVRIGSTITTYLNGQQIATGTSSAQVPSTGSVGLVWVGSSFYGNISNVRIVKGVGVYTGNFTVPNTGLRATQNADTNISAITGTSTVLLMLQNGLTNDASSYNTTLTNTGATMTVYNLIVGRQSSAAAQYLPGYISNLRMVYGTAVYTSKFVVPTSPLTAIDNTTFLGLQSSVTLDSSVNNITITRGSGATGLLLSPLTSPFTTYLPTVTNGNSIAFGWGSATPSDYLTITTGYVTSTQLPGDFTIESWIYMAVMPSSAAVILDTRTAIADAGYNFQVTSAGLCTFVTSNAQLITGTTVIAPNTWYHLAVTRQQGVLKLWINGIQETTTVASTSDFGIRTQSTIRVGASINPQYFSGYLSNTRLIIGTAIYTGTFTPSITPYSLTTPSSTNTLAVNGVTTYPSINNPNGVNYNGSYYFGGATASSQQINLANTGNAGRFEIGVYDFTIEAWFNCTATTAGNYTIVSAGNATAGYTDYSWSVYVYKTSATAGILGFQSYIGSSSFNPTYTGNINSNQWYHMAIVRIGTSFNMYLNGVNVATSTTLAASPSYWFLGSQLSASTTIAIGALYSTAPYTNNFYGYISNVRVMKGYGVYTGAFTPPTVALNNTQDTGSFNTSAITGTSTSLLALQNGTTTDSSTNNFTLTATGSPTLSSTVFPAFSVTNGYSGYFTGGYAVSVNGGLTGALNGLTTGSTGDYTVESWVYMTGTGPTGTDYTTAYLICGTSDVRTTIGFTIGITTVGYLFMSRNSGSYITVNNTIPSMNTWAHLAFVNVGTTMNIYLNGTKLSNTVSLTGTWTPSAFSLTSFIGSSGYGAFTGYISNFRAVGGVAVYTGNFTVPTSPLTATQSSGTNISAITAGQTKLLVLQNSLYTDASSSNYTLTNYNGILYNNITPFAVTNGYSVQFTGSSQYLNAPSDSAFTLGTGDFTIEGWIYLSSGTSGTLYDSRTGATTVSPQIYIASSIINYAVAGVNIIIGSTVSIATWYHIAVVRISNITKLYVNGTQSGSTYADINNYVIGSPYIGTGYNTSNPLAGYISNLRVVKGLGVYNNTFTTPVNALTSTQSSSGTIISLGNAIPSLGNSVYFNGANDYMRVPGFSTYMGTGNFTVETYYYPTSFAAITTIIGQYPASTVDRGYWQIQVTTAGIVTAYYNGSTSISASTRILVNEWVHIALVRIGITITLYINGVSNGTATYSTSTGVFGDITDPSTTVDRVYTFIGASQVSGPGQYAFGYMSNLRVVKGLGVYTGAFTVPTSPLGATQSSGTNITAITGTSTTLLLFQNSPFTDNSTFNNTVIGFGNPQYSPVFSPSFFSYPTPTNGNSGYFNGTNAYLSLAQPAHAGTNDFTVECWIYPTAIGTASLFISTEGTAVLGNFHIGLSTTNTVNFYVDQASAPNITSTTIAKINTWTHIAVVRSGSLGTIYMFVNGVKQATTINKATQFGTGGTLNIGRYQPSANQYFTGYITNLRFVYGYGLYSGSSVYITPNYLTPFTTITGTTLLLLQTTLTKDNSTNNITVTNNNAILSIYTNPYTMLKLPALLTAQNNRDVTSTTGFRDNSMYNATLTSGSLANASHQNTVSPFGITPTLLLGQSSMTRDNSINNYAMAIGSGTPNLMPYVTPFNGDAIAFNGTTQYITGSSLYNGLGGDFTIEFFMMAGPQTATVGGLILGKNDVYTTSFNNYYIMCSQATIPGNTIRIYNYALNTSGPVYAGTIPVCDSKWHHIAIVRINNIVTVYVDGIADTGTLGTINRFTSTTTWDYSNYTIGSAPTTSGYTVAQLAYNGMLSNMRIINGTGIYTGTFTPPTNNLTKSQTSGTNIVAYTPSAPPSSTSYSLQFRSQISAYPYIGPALVGTNLFNNDYTVEFWYYLSGRVTGSVNPCFFSNGNRGTAGNLNMYAGNTDGDITKYQISFNTNSFPSYALVSNTSIIYGKWTHIAVVRRSGIVYLYINGVLDSSSTYGNYNVYGIYWYIGTSGEGNSNWLNGFISNFRVVNGVSVYTGNFTVPTSALTATQSSGTNIAAISNSLVANGGATNYYGTYQTLSTYYGAPLHFNTGKSDWTFETWVFLNTLPTVDTWAAGSMVLFGSDSAVTTDGIHCVIGTTQLFIAAANVKYGTALHGMSLYTWYHVAYVRYNNIVYFYVNGALVGTVTDVPVPGTQSTTYIAGAANTGTYSLNGYMSNLRFVRGVAVYTNAFTPSIIIPASQNSSTNVNAITGTSTSVLALQNSTTTDASANNFTLTVNGTPSPAVDTTIVPPFYYANGYSAYFNGGSSNDKLTLASSSAFDLSSGTYTIECWFYALTQPSAGNNTRLFMFGTNDTNPAQAFGFGPNNTIQMGGAFAGFTSLSSSTNAYSLNTWNHLAFVTYLGKATIYLNGAVVAGPLAMTQIVAGATTLNIGYDTVASVNFQYNGYLSNVRIVKGVAVYTGPFTPPTSPLTITQGSGTNISAITGVTPANGYSLAFVSSSSQQLTLPSNAAFAMGTGSFTIECWFYTFSAGVAQAIYDTRSPTDTANIGYDLYLSASGPSIRFGTNATNYVIGTTTILSNKWYHVAVVRESTTVIKMYLNGVQESTTYTASATQNFTNNTPKIGGGAGGFFNGYISNLRVVKGQALYTTTFTPSATPLTTTSQGISTGTVSLLTAQNATIIDNSTNAFTITNSSSAVIPNSAITPFLGETELLMLQNTLVNDSSINLLTATKTGSPVLNLTNTTYMPFTYANGKSVFFNGPSNYITIPSDAAFTFGTGDFTIEGWIYISSGTTGTLFDSRTGSSTVHPVLYVSGTVRYRVAGTDVIVGSTLSGSTWYHIAVSRNSGSTRLYVNGTQAGSTYTDSNDYIIGAPLVGAGYGYNAPLIGYISNLRVVKDTGVYPSKFNPITTPLTITQTSTTNVQAISAKLPVNGNAAYASGGISVRGQFTYGTGFLFPNNFTIEAWINPYSLTTAYRSWFDSRISSGDTTGICVGLTNTAGQWGAFSANNTNYVVSSVNLSLNTWQHVAVVRIGVTMTLYLNGQNVGSATITNSFTAGNSYLGSQSDVTYGWMGYISNLRVVRDVAVYTGNFTPPTSPLTWYQPSGTNIVGSTKPSAFTNGSSVFFNGTTDYLVAPHIAAYQFTGNYSIECWFYTTTVDTSQMIMSKVSNKSTIDWYLKLNAYPGNGSTYATSSDPNSCQLEFYQGSPSVLIQSPIITTGSDTRTRMGGVYPNTWNHVAVIRAANVYYMILNGASYNMGATVAGTPAYDITNNLNIGVNGVDYASNFFSGYITNVRIVNGTFAYTPSYYFSPSFMPLSTTQALNNFVASQTQNQTGVTPVTASQTAFLGLQNTITGDNSTNNNTLTAYGTPSLSTAEHPFTLPLNGYSAYFNGAAFLFSTNTPADFTTNTAWTMEAWFQWSITTLPAQSVIMQVHTTTTNLVSIRVNSSRNIVYNLNGAAAITTGAIVTSNVWHHVALVKNGATTTLYFNGVNQGTTTSVPTTGVRTLVIGYDNINNANYFTGYISNARIVKDVAVYTGAFTVPTSPLTLTQSSGTNISAIAGASTLAFVITRDMITDLAGGFTMQVGGGSAWPTIPHIPFSPFLTATNYIPSLLAFQTSYMNDTSPSKALFSLTGVQAGDATWMDYTYSPFGNITSLLTARTGKNVDNSVSSRFLSTAGYFTRVITPSGVQTPTAFLGAQTTAVLSDAGADDLATQGIMTSPANASTNSTFGPFNSDTPLLTFQDSIIIDNSNVRAQMTVVGGGVVPTDTSPFSNKSLTSLLIPYGYVDISYANASIANNANVASMNSTYNPFTIPSSTVSVLGLQTSNTLLESSIYNSTFTTSGTAPTSNAFSPFGTYYANGILTLNTSGTTGIPGNTINYANLLVTAGDGTTNAYSITVTSLSNVGNIGNTNTFEMGYRPTQANANISLVDLGNANINEATILTFANTNITPSMSFVDYGISVAPSNITFIITDVANSNLSETLSDIFVSNVSAIRIPTDSGLINISPSNITFFISDVANSNISETIANVTISNVSTTRSIQDTGTQPPPSPVGGTVLFPTYAYTDGITITAANVDSGGSGGSTTASNQQIWYQT